MTRQSKQQFHIATDAFCLFGRVVLLAKARNCGAFQDDLGVPTFASYAFGVSVYIYLLLASQVYLNNPYS